MTSSLNLLHDNIIQLQLKTFDVYLLRKSSHLGQMLKKAATAEVMCVTDSKFEICTSCHETHET